MMSILIVVTAMFFGAAAYAAAHAWLFVPALAFGWVACIVTDLRPGAVTSGVRSAAAACARLVRTAGARPVSSANPAQHTS